MAKLKAGDITAVDLQEYLDSNSDFAFEMKVLKMLQGAGGECRHSASYIDPVTKKPRQFDIRATFRATHEWYSEARLYYRMAVECKNIRANNPLLIAGVPRTREEAFHDVVAKASAAKVLRLRSSDCVRRVGQIVGKSPYQIGRLEAGWLVENDAEFYDKWAQALASATDLVDEAFTPTRAPNTIHFSVVLPIVVVPNGRLWLATYDDNGQQVGSVEPADSIAYYIGHRYPLSDIRAEYVASHLDIMTLTGLHGLIESVNGRSALEKYFPDDSLKELMAGKG